MGKDGKNKKLTVDKEGVEEGGSDDPDAVEHAYREMALKDLSGSTVDACITAEARLRHMQRDKQVYADAWPELIVSVLLHLCAQIYQYVILILFTAAKIERIYFPYQPHMLYHSTSSLMKALNYHNQTLANPAAYALCAMNRSFPWIHRMMMCVWITKMIPEISNCLWRMYKMWISDPIPNHDAHSSDQRILNEGYTYQEHTKKSLGDYLKDEKKKFCKIQAKKCPWWEKDKVQQAWKDRILLVDANGLGRKTSDKIWKGKSKDDKDYIQEIFPVKVILTEQEEAHEIGEFSVVWVMFCSVFVLVPNLLIILYIAYEGARLISVTGDLGRLVKTAIKLKFLNSIPEILFDGYGCQNLKDYLDSTTYKVRIVKDEDDIWNKWLSTATKLVVAAGGGVIIYTLGFHHVYLYRKLCDQFYDEFPTANCLSLDCTGMRVW